MTPYSVAFRPSLKYLLKNVPRVSMTHLLLTTCHGIPIVSVPLLPAFNFNVIFCFLVGSSSVSTPNIHTAQHVKYCRHQNVLIHAYQKCFRNSFSGFSNEFTKVKSLLFIFSLDSLHIDGNSFFSSHF